MTTPAASAHDVVQYVIRKLDRPVPTLKLQKLAYYCHAWSLVWDDRPLFGEEIEAWANGPIIPDVYHAHHGMYSVHEWSRGSAYNLDAAAKETVDAVLKHYGGMSGFELSDLTHSEDPWLNARRGLTRSQRGHVRMRDADMAEYYGSL